MENSKRKTKTNGKDERKNALNLLVDGIGAGK